MKDWFALWSALVQLGIESNHVVASRMKGLATGRGDARELTRMVSEKGKAWMRGALIAWAATGKGKDAPAVLTAVVNSYRRAVRGNRRRLR
jgi:hypothetical protein